MSTPWQRCLDCLRDHPRPVDAAVAVLLFAAAGPGSRISGPGSTAPAQWWPAVLLAAVASTALLWHREHPRAVVAVTAVCGTAIAALGYLPSIFVLGPLVVALYSLANRTDRRTANTAAVGVVVAITVAAVVAHPEQSLDITLIAPAALLLLPVAVGIAARTRRDYLQAVRARAEHAERTREQEARHRVAEERMRIARELHDVVAHHLALANAQAGTAAHLARTRPEQTREILAQLADTTSAALRELKATVGLLRQTDDPDAPLQPAPGLAQLPELTASLASAGLRVTVTTQGEPRPLSPGADLTAFRIVQEALTNVTKHAAVKTAQVTLAYTRDLLSIRVTNDAAAAPPDPRVSDAPVPGSGFGLIGMRERAHSIGGSLRTGPRPDGGFEVAATLPLHPSPPRKDPRP